MPSLRTAVALTLTAAAALAPAGVAVADPAPAARGLAGTLPSTPVTDALPTRYVLGGLDAALAGGVAPVKHLTLDPLANTGSDPLDNAVGSQIADFRPLSTALVTGPIARGGSLSTLPLVGKVVGLLPG
jgi:hypothetical protein